MSLTCSLKRRNRLANERSCAKRSFPTRRRIAAQGAAILPSTRRSHLIGLRNLHRGINDARNFLRFFVAFLPHLLGGSRSSQTQSLPPITASDFNLLKFRSSEPPITIGGDPTFFILPATLPRRRPDRIPAGRRRFRRRRGRQREDPVPAE